VLDELAAVGSGQTLPDFLQEPSLVGHQPLYGLHHQRFGGPALLGSHVRKLAFQIGAQMHVHAVSLKLRWGAVKEAS